MYIYIYRERERDMRFIKRQHITQTRTCTDFLFEAFTNILWVCVLRKIVHVKRNSAAVCWGNFKQLFPSKSLGYCYGLDDIVAYYALYQNLMQFWEIKLPNKIYNLDYELLTINQEDETKKLIQHLGLDWENKCLSPQNNRMSVATASNMQVRQAVYQGSSEQWKKYEPFLNGVFDGLLLS